MKNKITSTELIQSFFERGIEYANTKGKRKVALFDRDEHYPCFVEGSHVDTKQIAYKVTATISSKQMWFLNKLRVSEKKKYLDFPYKESSVGIEGLELKYCGATFTYCSIEGSACRSRNYHHVTFICSTRSQEGILEMDKKHFKAKVAN